MIPTVAELLLPVLTELSDGKPQKLAAIRTNVATQLELEASDLDELMPNGRATVIDYRVSWALTNLKFASLVERPERGFHQLTTAGKELLASKPEAVDRSFLRANYPEYVSWRQRSTKSIDKQANLSETSDIGKSPAELIEDAVDELTNDLKSDLLGYVRQGTPKFFENVVVDLMTAMGYGGGDPNKAQVMGKTGDGGIDGTIREDSLGLDEVYIQAKRYAEGNSVGQPAVQNFAGAIDAAGTLKGVFVTTSTFTSAAKQFVERSPKRIVLIDGEELARLMVVHGIGVRTEQTFKIRRLDADYFDQDRIDRT